MEPTGKGDGGQDLRVFGIRHHGPGSARSLLRALEAFAPDRILVEGPPEGDDLIPLVAAQGMEPPVSMVIYQADSPKEAVFYPFAAYSPEWVALRYAVDNGVRANFMDLPRIEAPETEDGEKEPEEIEELDPIGALASIAGHADGESWWDAFVESRGDDAEGTFDAVTEAMAALREGRTVAGREAMREAYMRTCMRDAIKDGAKRIAVVCGAWHAPALLDHSKRGQAGEDAKVLKGLPRKRALACWAPWSYARLASAGGYAAGVDSPEWYHALWNHPENPGTRWLSNAAGLMRKADLPASSASVIEAARLANALAALRGRERPLLSDLRESALSILCNGDPAPMAVVHRELVVGLRLGAVPETAARTPVQADFEASCKAARLQPEAGDRDITLDLRQPLDLKRSHLLNRLIILGVRWGTRQRAQGTGTFKEVWALKWAPEYAVDLVAASARGSTIVDAATAISLDRALAAESVSELADQALELLDADLPEASRKVVRLLTDRAAEGGDVIDLMKAIPTLANLMRYGSVRGTDSGAVRTVVEGLVARVAAGLPYACRSLDDEAAANVAGLIGGVENAIVLLENEDLAGPWRGALAHLSESEAVHGQVAGRATRLLFDAGKLEAEEAGRRLHLALSRAADAKIASAWFEGFLAGGGSMLVYNRVLLGTVDEWLCGLDEEAFVAILPLIRRTFSTMASAERRGVKEALATPVGKSTSSVEANADDPSFDHARAASALALLNRIMGAPA